MAIVSFSLSQQEVKQGFWLSKFVNEAKSVNDAKLRIDGGSGVFNNMSKW